MTDKSNFKKALELNVSDKTKNKGGQTYLSWSFAWAEFKKIYPDGKYKILKQKLTKLPFFEVGGGFMVWTQVTANGEKHKMWLPVLDYKNQPLKNPTVFDYNKALMRCLTKNLAMFGIGLYVYSGEDLPENYTPPQPKKTALTVSMVKPWKNAIQSYRKTGNLDAVLKRMTVSKQNQKLLIEQANAQV